MKQLREWRVLADNQGEFSDFAPYVPAINDIGQVAFQAQLKSGEQCVYLWTEDQLQCVAKSQTGPFEEVISHPDLAHHKVCFYVKKQEQTYLIAYENGQSEILNISNQLGPLGPTMNSQGDIAFRAIHSHSQQIIGMFDGKNSLTIASSGKDFIGFHGLPVINGNLQLVFRADLPENLQAIYMYQDGQLEKLIQTTDVFSHLGFFPDLTESGTLVFTGKTHTGRSGLYTLNQHKISPLIESERLCIRGGLMNDVGKYLVFASFGEEPLGVYIGPDPAQDKLFSIGDPMEDSVIVDFALNPVSLNQAGQFVVRFRLENGKQLITLAEL